MMGTQLRNTKVNIRDNSSFYGSGLGMRMRDRNMEWRSGYHRRIEIGACADWQRVEVVVLEFQLGGW